MLSVHYPAMRMVCIILEKSWYFNIASLSPKIGKCANCQSFGGKHASAVQEFFVLENSLIVLDVNKDII
jgi:hypothetical protein